MSKKILIVEDSQDTRTQLANVLLSEKYEVIEAHDGEDGLSKLKSNPDVNLIISDFYMPSMNGLDMCQKIKNEVEFQKIPLMMLTTESSDELRSRGKDVGVLAWIVKPFCASGILNAINLVLTGKIRLNEKGLSLFQDPEMEKNKGQSPIEDRLLQLEKENRLLKEKLQAAGLKEKLNEVQIKKIG
ncbi:MAG: response regulator [Oligoflexales bacterium]|nr:response regulator [Oligoflexales bacterium]